MHYNQKEISKILSTSTSSALHSCLLKNISFDSRKIIFPKSNLFFCLVSEKNNGHRYLTDAYNKGVRNFVVSDDVVALKDANYYKVDDTLQALQTLGKHHRDQQNIDLLAITGSYGKTIVKEWLNELLFESTNLVRSPKSYNSKIGVPYSLLQIKEAHELAIIEVGISQKGEMIQQLEMVKPSIGILTNIGSAHDEGFINQEEKIEEKLLLFKDCKKLILPKDDRFISYFKESKVELISWKIVHNDQLKKKVTLSINEEEIRLKVPFINKTSLQNLMPCICYLWLDGFSLEEIENRIQKLPEISMRLEMKLGVNETLIINDAYIADLSSLQMALDFQQENSEGKQRILIISDFAFHKDHKKEQYQNLNDLIKENNIDQLYTIGKESKEYLSIDNRLSFESLETAQSFFNKNPVSNACILIKGSRAFKLENLADYFSNQVHDTVLEIDLNALGQNVSTYRGQLDTNTQIMAVVKASAYGSGVEIAKTLLHHQIDFLAVAFPSEGITLRKSGIKLPIVILNPQSSSIPDLVQYKLEPEIYAVSQLNDLALNLRSPMSIHLNFNTGMNRLGLEQGDISAVLNILEGQPLLKIRSVFSHLSSSEDAEADDYNNTQVNSFIEIVAILKEQIGYTFLQHILNSAGIARLPQFQMSLVRLGLGMYGIDPSGHFKHLQKVHKLKTKIIQIKSFPKGSFIGYNKKQELQKDSRIATIPVGYADGIPINLGLGKYFFIVNGQRAETVGKICMDLIMLDVTEIQAKVGEEVILFDSNHSIEKMAKAAKTIPYDILSRISPRVKRIYIHD